jgi:hypothetical protein
MTVTSGALRWRHSTGTTDDPCDTGLEHVELRVAETGISAEGVAIGGEAAGWATRWRMTVDPDWACVRSLHLTRLGGPTVALRHDGLGEWSDGEGRRRAEFAGLTDCVVEGSPFGLLALFARLGRKRLKKQSIDVVAVSVPDFVVARTTLHLEPSDGGRRVVIDRGDRREIVELDADGVILGWGDGISLIPPAVTEAVVSAAE